ncbi:MAG: type II secretion system secretin GspD [Candidatus Euphemobacter frigidus]|nr:type II secretion system secretin GspD [Candidatus Euphemobacter frigidus]MDP8276712.1 type II secretion system secretin GspD [Candidatus Euphemobacter frigidus]
MKYLRKLIVAIWLGLLLGLLISQGLGRAQTGGFEEEDGLVSMDFENTEIRVVIKYISDLTGKNFIIDQNVRGPVTVISPTKIPLDEVYKVFESILEVRGFVTVPSGKVIKISTKKEASKRNIAMSVGDNLEQIVPEDTIITQLIPLQYADVQKVRTALGQLFSKDSSVIAYPVTNTLIVTDISSNIHRLVKIIKELDIPGYETRITVVPIRYAAADILAGELSQVIEEAGKVPGAPPTPRRRQKAGQLQTSEKNLKIIPDERTNSLIILANDEDTKRVLDLIKRLDVETERSNIHVYFLKNTNAEDMAKVLNSIVSKRKPKGGEEPALISEDKGTNALIIDATQEAYADLIKIIQKLDVVRDQVLVEVLIAEIAYDKTFELGVDWIDMDNDGTGFPDIATMGTGRNNAEGMAQSVFSGALSSWATDAEGGHQSPGIDGLSLGFIQKMAGTGTSLPDFAVMLHALQTNSDVNILATPQVLTMDNEEAKIKVVRNIPYVSKIEIGSTDSRDYQDIEYKDVGIELTITPHISKAQMVRMEIHQKISSLTSGEVSGGVTLTPETFDRETETSVIVKDNHTIVIGGLIRDDWYEAESKIPILGDIPLIGNLFRQTSTRKEKNNLLIFITPRVVRTTQQIADLTNLKRHQAPELDSRIKGRESEMADRERETQKKEAMKYQDLKASYALQLGAMKDYEEAHRALPPPDELPIAPAGGDSEMKPVGKSSTSRSFLDSLPNISFGRHDESEEDQKGTGRFHK